MTLSDILARLKELADGLAHDLHNYGCIGLEGRKNAFIQTCSGIREDVVRLLRQAISLGAFTGDASLITLSERLKEDRPLDAIFDGITECLRQYCSTGPGYYRATKFDIFEPPDQYKAGDTGFESMQYIHTVLLAFIALVEEQLEVTTQSPIGFLGSSRSYSRSDDSEDGTTEPNLNRTEKAVLKVLQDAGIELKQVEITARVPEVDPGANSGKVSVRDALNRLIELDLVEKLGKRGGCRAKTGPKKDPT